MNLPSTSDGLVMALLLSMAVEGLLQLGDVEFCHGENRPHDALNARLVPALQDLWKEARHDLPRDAELVGQPAALPRLAAFAEPLPQAVDLGLIGAIDDEGDRRGESELRAAVQRQERLSLDLEQDGHHRALTPGAGLAIARVRDDAALPE